MATVDIVTDSMATPAVVTGSGYKPTPPDKKDLSDPGTADGAKSSKSLQSGIPGKKILLSNLPKGWTDEKFGDMVRKIGQIVEHQELKRNKALYTFDESREAAEAVSSLNGIVVNGKKIKVAFDSFVPYSKRGKKFNHVENGQKMQNSNKAAFVENDNSVEKRSQNKSIEIKNKEKMEDLNRGENRKVSEKTLAVKNNVGKNVGKRNRWKKVNFSESDISSMELEKGDNKPVIISNKTEGDTAKVSLRKAKSTLQNERKTEASFLVKNGNLSETKKLIEDKTKESPVEENKMSSGQKSNILSGKKSKMSSVKQTKTLSEQDVFIGIEHLFQETKISPAKEVKRLPERETQMQSEQEFFHGIERLFQETKKSSSGKTSKILTGQETKTSSAKDAKLLPGKETNISSEQEFFLGIERLFQETKKASGKASKVSTKEKTKILSEQEILFGVERLFQETKMLSGKATEILSREKNKMSSEQEFIMGIERLFRESRMPSGKKVKRSSRTKKSCEQESFIGIGHLFQEDAIVAQETHGIRNENPEQLRMGEVSHVEDQDHPTEHDKLLHASKVEPTAVTNIDKPLAMIRIMVASTLTGAIIGRKGETIRKILAESKATSIQVLSEVLPWSEQIIEIKGLGDSCDIALQLILEQEITLSLNNGNAVYSSDLKKQAELRLLVMDYCCGQLIGKSGYEMRSICDDTNTNINVAKVFQYMEIYPERVMTIRGDVAGVVKAQSVIRWKISEFLANRPTNAVGRYGRSRFVASPSSEDMTYRIEIREQHAGRLIGEYANNMRDMMRDARAYITVESKMFQYSPENPKKVSRWVRITGSREAVFRASYAVFDRLSECVKEKNAFTFHANSCMEIPRDMIGRIIGKDGWKVKYLEQSSGASISIDQELNRKNDVRVHMTGCFVAMQKAVNLIQKIVFNEDKTDDQSSSPLLSRAIKPFQPDRNESPPGCFRQGSSGKFNDIPFCYLARSRRSSEGSSFPTTPQGRSNSFNADRSKSRMDLSHTLPNREYPNQDNGYARRTPNIQHPWNDAQMKQGIVDHGNSYSNRIQGGGQQQRPMNSTKPMTGGYVDQDNGYARRILKNPCLTSDDIGRGIPPRGTTTTSVYEEFSATDPLVINEEDTNLGAKTLEDNKAAAMSLKKHLLNAAAVPFQSAVAIGTTSVAVVDEISETIKARVLKSMEDGKKYWNKQDQDGGVRSDTGCLGAVPPTDVDTGVVVATDVECSEKVDP